ncbi:MAG: sporulation transcription factor Spo0A, partial [Acidobacteria bacterium]
MRPAIRRKKVKVFIADDSLKVVERLTDLLKQVVGLELIGHAVDGPAAAESVLKLNPDVVILAFRMPKGNGIEVL